MSYTITRSVGGIPVDLVLGSAQPNTKLRWSFGAILVVGLVAATLPLVAAGLGIGVLLTLDVFALTMSLVALFSTTGSQGWTVRITASHLLLAAAGYIAAKFLSTTVLEDFIAIAHLGAAGAFAYLTYKAGMAVTGQGDEESITELGWLTTIPVSLDALGWGVGEGFAPKFATTIPNAATVLVAMAIGVGVITWIASNAARHLNQAHAQLEESRQELFETVAGWGAVAGFSAFLVLSLDLWVGGWAQVAIWVAILMVVALLRLRKSEE